MSTELFRGRYESLGVVGSGGEAEVIRAVDRRHGRYVALKVRRAGDDGLRTQLLSEARVLLSLSPHPGLPLVREDFFVDERYVIAMDWIDGTDLEAMLARDGRPGLDPALVIDYLSQAAGALAHLHGHDPPVVHGDVKPANMILTSSGRLVLVDFGLSSTPADEPRRAGTAGYAAPELAAGTRPAAAADVYSLAATALALLTGAPLSAGAPSWGAIDPERIPALERIVRPNLATDPARRDSSAPAFVARLRRWWGADLPSGTVTLVLADIGEDEADEVALVHGGHCVAPAADGPQLLAFAAPADGFDAARELAGRGARAAAVTGQAELRAGTYRGETRAEAARLLELAGAGQALLDDATAAIDSRLPPDIGVAELPSAWAVVASGLSVPPRANTSPYRGLIAFDSDDGDVFFGREAVGAAILERLRGRRFMAVVGASGSGKSSLVRAGVVPVWDGPVVVLTPGADPAMGLEHALSAGTPSLLVVDQLEEVFTLCPDEANRACFVDRLIDLWEARSAAVVVTLRADFYGRCAEHPRLAAALAAHQHLLGPMRNDELRRAIEGPARAAGLRLEPGLVDIMLADVEGEPGGLPLLSHALYESWLRRDGRVLTREGYLAAGGVRGAIARTAEDAYLGCTEHEQLIMRRLFLQLTELGEATEDTRRRVPVAELIPAEHDAEKLLERLTGARLLVVGDDSAEIAHEALIREWPRLQGWLTDDREELQSLRQLTTAARGWDEAGRDEADLYRGPRLAAAADLAADAQRLSRAERDFLQASRDAQERELRNAQRRARRLRALLAGVAAALVAALVAGAFALSQRGSARHAATVAQAGRLAAQSRELAEHHPDLALLLALEADRRHGSVDSRGALLGALEHGSRIRAWLHGFDAPVNGAVFSRDGKRLATVTQNGAQVWDTTTWHRVGPPLETTPADGVDFSPDGHLLAVAGGTGVDLWDVATGKKVRQLRDARMAVVRYSPDGSLIAAGGQDANHITLWDSAGGRRLRRLVTNPPGGGAQSLGFSPDSRRIAAPGAPGTVGIWDVATGRRVGEPLRVGEESVENAIFARGGRMLVAADDGGSVSLIDLATRKPVGRPFSVGDTIASSLALSPDGRLLAAASYDGPVHVWDTRTGAAYGAPLSADTTPVSQVAFSPDGRMLVSASVGSAVVWSMDGEQAIGKPLGGRSDLITDVAFSPDGRWLAAGRFDGATTVYNAATRRAVRRIGGGSTVSSVAFSPDGSLIVVATIDGKVGFFDSSSGRAAGPAVDAGPAAVWQVAFSPDGRLLAAAVDPNSVQGFDRQQRQGEVQLWDVQSRSRVGPAIRPGAGSVLSTAYSRDGRLLATGSYQGQLDLWDVPARTRHGKPMRVTDDGVLRVAFDPGGRLVTGTGAIGPVRVWRVRDQRPAFPPLAGHSTFVTGAAFGGGYLATTSIVGDTRLWDPATGLGYGEALTPATRPVTLTVPDLPFLGLGNAFSPDGKRLAISGVKSLAMVWDVDPAVWRRQACAIAGRNLTREEWKLYLPAGKPYRATCSEWPAS